VFCWGRTGGAGRLVPIGTGRPCLGVAYAVGKFRRITKRTHDQPRNTKQLVILVVVEANAQSAWRMITKSDIGMLWSAYLL
jgi:hypothetical protein